MHKQKLVDIVNLNADASCLGSKRWLKALEGGKESELYTILNTYVQHKAKVNLGIVGTTLSEILAYNPECIELINDHPECFEMVIRPFVHSLSILWADETYKRNFSLGKNLIEDTFNNVINWYLPPEFAMRNSQVHFLVEMGIEGTFVHPKRIKADLWNKMPDSVFNLKVIQASELMCVPFTNDFDTYYLEMLQQFSSDIKFSDGIIYGWRDGESPFFLPKGEKREIFFIEHSTNQFERIFLSEALEGVLPNVEFKSYPQNSLLPWLGDFRLIWFINEVKLMESQFSQLSGLKKELFLNLLNSDILSSIEKDNVELQLLSVDRSKNTDYVIKRKEKNLNAEELLYMLRNMSDEDIMNYIARSESSYFKKLKARISYLTKIELS